MTPTAGLPESWVLVVTASVDPAVEDEWNQWYSDVHLPEIAACPGFLDAARYVSVDEHDQRTYLTLYRLDGQDAAASTEFSERRGWAHFEPHVKAEVRLHRRIEATK